MCPPGLVDERHPARQRRLQRLELAAGRRRRARPPPPPPPRGSSACERARRLQGQALGIAAAEGQQHQPRPLAHLLLAAAEVLAQDRVRGARRRSPPASRGPRSSPRRSPARSARSSPGRRGVSTRFTVVAPRCDERAQVGARRAAGRSLIRIAGAKSRMCSSSVSEPRRRRPRAPGSPRARRSTMPSRVLGRSSGTPRPRGERLRSASAMASER